MEGELQANRGIAEPTYLTSGDPGMKGGGTLASVETGPSLEQYENIFGPVARDIKQDSQRHKRHQRWHLPDVLKGANTFLTDRIDGLITDATNSPFTRNILPYVYLENPDQKLKWNVYSFDEGIASRVPYEAAARVLPQTKRSFAGYVVRQGLAIAMEHNFMMSAKGQENFRNQLTQLVGSIQLTNDLDVHVALLTAPSYQKHINEKYMDSRKTMAHMYRKNIDMFGIMQKVPNALDFLIEDAKTHLKTWGSQPPTFCLCNGAMQVQLTMIPEKTNYITNGPDGLKRLAQGPDLPSYRGLQFINSRKFSMDTGTAPRDLLRRRVRVAEYYIIKDVDLTTTDRWQLYDQSRDSFFEFGVTDLLKMSRLPVEAGEGGGGGGEDREGGGEEGEANADPDGEAERQEALGPQRAGDRERARERGAAGRRTFLILRPNIEHEMLGVVFGRGGTQELGATFWGQTELSCYDDAQHGIWGMSYKYHERALVTNERNLIRVYDVAFDGYNGGMDNSYVEMTDGEDRQRFKDATNDKTVPYDGQSMIVMNLRPSGEQERSKLPTNPIYFSPSDEWSLTEDGVTASDRHKYTMQSNFTHDQLEDIQQYNALLGIERWLSQVQKQQQPGESAVTGMTAGTPLAFEGTLNRIPQNGVCIKVQAGSGHLGPSFPGSASIREGRGTVHGPGPVTLGHLV